MVVWFCSSLYHHKHSKLNHFCWSCGSLKCQLNIIIILRMRTIRESSSTPCPWWMLCSSFITWPSSFWSSDSSSQASLFVSHAPQMARQGITTWASSGEDHTMCCLGSGCVGCRSHWQKFNRLSQLYTLKTQQCLTNNKWKRWYIHWNKLYNVYNIVSQIDQTDGNNICCWHSLQIFAFKKPQRGLMTCN